ncbi:MULTISPECIES: putative T7SS-secreted protein [unclassified Streptomyces]|uniref:putative T7SS-secreted protein n=1 Tax=unclassified Streptomyces TaxID=2593676 RepID=UPI002DDAFAD3|nr:hypothetical protein [Streptomyces sp. NBC_01766]WSC20611.1 hypothetical protein OIE60_13435 [Streptomyces sp. NBC_01766]WSV54640.1 hypothetical protein OG282_13490 [Streptomyces sp. NBC_01014]
MPGDPPDIRKESTRLGKLARTINDQVKRLEAIGRDADALKGKYADSLRDKAEELSGKLAKTHHRYQNVSGYLGHWADDLEGFQKRADDALGDAKEAQQRVDAHQPHEKADAPGHKPTDAEHTAETKRKHALSDAEDALGAARTKMDNAVSDYTTQADHWAGKIRRAISKDGLHDTKWDKFKSWVDDHSRLLNDLANVLVWIATACAIVALFIPGLNILAIIALSATVGSLLLHTTTALAGDGSWIDVGLDVFALATFGLGRLATPGIRAAEQGARTATRGAGAMNLGKAAWNAAKTEVRPAMSQAGRIFKTGVRGSEEWNAARKSMSDGMKAMWAAKKGALADAKALTGKALPELSAWKNLIGGGAEAASAKAYLGEAAARFPGSARIASSIAGGAGSLRLSQGAFAASMGVDAFDKALGMVEPFASGHLGGSGTNFWTDTKTWATTGAGSAW